MKLTTQFMTRNDCYKANRKIKPTGIMVHSTATPGVMAAGWFSRWNKSYSAGEINRQVCVHAFLDDSGVWQYLPWDHRGWHAGGKANDTHIGFEICEPGGFSYGGGATMVGYNVTKNQPYFDAIWENTVALCVYLCKLYNLTEQAIICHSEGYKKGIASNHGDVMHWWPKHGKNMDMLRAAVKAQLGGTVTPTPPPTPTPTPGGALKVGDQVTFTGGGVYLSANATSPRLTRTATSVCKITQTYNGQHPYHLISQDGKGVYGWVNAASIKEAAATSPVPTVGDLVNFKGGAVYRSSAASSVAATRQASRCKVTAESKGGKHPYHLISQDGKGVYGWVDASTVTL